MHELQQQHAKQVAAQHNDMLKIESRNHSLDRRRRIVVSNDQSHSHPVNFEAQSHLTQINEEDISKRNSLYAQPKFITRDVQTGGERSHKDQIKLPINQNNIAARKSSEVRAVNKGSRENQTHARK